VSAELTSFRAPDVPTEPFSFGRKAPGMSAREGWSRVLARATDDVVSRPLWELSPGLRPLFLAERRRRFGVPSADDFDPEYH